MNLRALLAVGEGIRMKENELEKLISSYLFGCWKTQFIKGDFGGGF